MGTQKVGSLRAILQIFYHVKEDKSSKRMWLAHKALKERMEDDVTCVQLAIARAQNEEKHKVWRW